MDERLESLAVEAAQELLHRYKLAHPEWTDDRTPLDELAAWLGLDIATFHPDDYPPGTFGFLEPQENLVWLCRNLTPTLRRFTLAHELGHAVLHRESSSIIDLAVGASPEDPCQTFDVREEVTGAVYQEQVEEALGIGLTYDPRSQRELAANIFAAELLMPRERVRALYLARELSPGKLASVFDVSNAAMLNRLAGLLTESGSTLGKAGTISAAPSPKKQYDEFQQAAIQAPTPALIVAGPGSGKTSTLIGRAEYLIQALSVQPHHILALTFSRKAAEEMQERLQQVLDPERIPPVSTFHAFCAEQLRTYGSLVGLRQDFAFIDDAGGYFLLRRLAAALPLHHYQNLQNPAAFFPDILSAISRAKDELVTPGDYNRLAQQMLEHARDEKEREQAERALEVADIYALYQERLERQGDTDFGGLIMLTVQLLQEHAELRQELQQKYQHILVDEFQDINRASGVLLRLLAGEQRRVWVVGDANQAIYGFRGASPANIANFRHDYPDAVILPLSRNYRSRPDIVRLADAFRCRQLEQDAEQNSMQPVRSSHPDPYVALAVAAGEASELHGLIDDIRRKRAGGYAFRDMVVLCRTRALVRKITRALVKADLPVSERGSMLEQEHIKNLLSILILLVEPGGMGILRAARQGEHPLSQSDIEALLQAAREQRSTPAMLILRDEAPITMSSEGCRSLTRLSSILRSLLNTASSAWSLLAQYLFIETSIGRDLLCAGNAQAKALRADYAGLLQLARYYDQQQQKLRAEQEQEALARGEEPAQVAQSPSIQEQARGFLDYLSVLLALRQDGGGRREGTESSSEQTPDVIRVMTVHASKGLEFPVVYLPGIAHLRFPAQRRAHAAPPPLGMIAAGGDEATMHETGEACLFYVGTTRARDHLVLSYAERYGQKAYRRSGYIDTLLASLPEERIMRLAWQNKESLAGENIVAAGDSQDAVISSQPGKQFIEAMKPKTLRVTELETYQRCPRQYLYSTIYGFRSEEATYQLFWKATRQTLDALQEKMRALEAATGSEAHIPTQEEVRELYSQHWRELNGHTYPFASLYERHGHEVAELLLRKLLERGDITWQMRPTFAVELAGRTIEVTVDRVEVPADEKQPAKFVKTGFGRRKNKVDPTTRELLYARAYREHHPGQRIELHFHNMSTGETFQIKLTERKEQSLYNELEQVLLGLENDEFPAKPDPIICPTCPFFLICPA